MRLQLSRIMLGLSVAALIVAGTLGDYDASPGANNPILPPGIAFAIWGAIYGLAAWLAIHHARRRDPVVARVAPAIALGYVLAGVWVWVLPRLPFALGELVLATTLVAGLTALWRLPPHDTGRSVRWPLRAAIGCFAGWINLAVVVATVDGLIARGVIAPVGKPAWATALVAGLATVATAVTLVGRRGPGYPLAIAWGLGWLATSSHPAEHPGFTLACATGAVVLVGAALRTARRT